ncbi:MAG: tyrosine-type recombinase/integrase [Deltaproteobacteria bacterium]|nr:tyrosine-type recombinase/integrase [Deltaproteobacteria bacterium]
MTLVEAVENYITLKRSLGAVFSADARILRSFGRAVGDLPVDAIRRENCQAFCRGTGPPSRFWERKHYTLHAFFRHLVARGHLTAAPLPQLAPRIPRMFQAHVYSRDEMRRLLEATSILDTPWSRLRPATCRTLLLLLWGAGLRPGEALRLRCCDVDLAARILVIWDTKFFKSRLVPIGTDLCRALDLHRAAQHRSRAAGAMRAPFFCTRAGKPISLATLEKAFVRLREHAGIRRPPGDRWQPRLHDLRHAFALNRLIAWYREGADVQACLPLLATYMGHINISGTQTYLSMTPELLAEASRRFERYASIRKEDDRV